MRVGYDNPKRLTIPVKSGKALANGELLIGRIEYPITLVGAESFGFGEELGVHLAL